MSAGRLIAVVGPSGVGKDSVIDGIIAARPDIGRVRRVLTRAPGLGGEDYDARTPEQFLTEAANGAFCLHWEAHGLHYGLPADVASDVAAGAIRVANLSRAVLGQASKVFDGFVVLNITADPEVLAQRLQARGRESADDISRRLARQVDAFPDGIDIVTLQNDGPLEDTVARALAALGLTNSKQDCGRTASV